MKILLSGNEINFPEEASLYVQELYRRIKEAQKSIKIVSYVVHDEMFFKQLEGRLSNSKDLEVKLVVDKEGFSRIKRKTYSLKKDFPNNFYFKVYDIKGSSLHAKFIIFDDKEAIIGSHNITQNALFKNIELAVLIEEKDKKIKTIIDIFNEIWRVL